eukprot:4771502-Pyramimonas_sp.AAC.1
MSAGLVVAVVFPNPEQIRVRFVTAYHAEQVGVRFVLVIARVDRAWIRRIPSTVALETSERVRGSDPAGVRVRVAPTSSELIGLAQRAHTRNVDQSDSDRGHIPAGRTNRTHRARQLLLVAL